MDVPQGGMRPLGPETDPHSGTDRGAGEVEKGMKHVLIDDKYLQEEVSRTLDSLVFAWQLGVNAMGRYFTGGQEGQGQGQGLGDSQQSSLRLSQTVSQGGKGSARGQRDYQRYNERRSIPSQLHCTYGGGSQLLCTYGGESQSHHVLIQEKESVEAVLQGLFRLLVCVWGTFWDPGRDQGRDGEERNRGRGGADAGETNLTPSLRPPAVRPGRPT